MQKIKHVLWIAVCTAGIAAGAAFGQSESPFSPALNAQMDALVQITEQLRGLQTREPVERAFPTRDETIAYLTELYDRELPPEQLERVQLFYVALSLLEPDLDLRAVYLDLLGAQVAGFYDPDTKIMNVIPLSGDSAGDSLSLTEQIIFIHEYVHALQDQYFDLTLLDDEALNATPDRSLAALALVEGDATAVMQLYTRNVAARNPLAVLSILAEGLQAGNLFLPPDVPEVLANELLFPYNGGMTFVLALYEDGGWERINAAYADLPTTSEQVLHPEKYLSGEDALPVSLPDLGAALGESWESVWDVRLGEYYLREHLRVHLSNRAADRAAAGWGGDWLRIYHQPETGALAWALRVVWDTPADREDFHAAYALWGERRFGSAARDGCWLDDTAAACLIPESAGTLIVHAPDEATARALTAAAGE